MNNIFLAEEFSHQSIITQFHSPYSTVLCYSPDQTMISLTLINKYKFENMVFEGVGSQTGFLGVFFSIIRVLDDVYVKGKVSFTN